MTHSQLTPSLESPLESQYARPGGPWDVPPLDTLLSSAPARVNALVDGARVLSSAEVMDRSASLARAMAGLGVSGGSAVAWQLPNCIESVLLYRACWRLGAVAVPLHARAGSREVAAMVDAVGASVALRSTDEVAELAEREADEVAVSADDGRASVSPADVAVVLFTAGSTGEPKGVMHTHRALAYKARLMASVHGLGADDAVLMPAPLAHVSGLLNGVLVPGVAGMKCVLQSRWTPESGLDLIEREGVTFMVGPPTFFTGMLESPSFSARAVDSLRLVSCGGAGVSRPFVERAARELDAVVKRTYGSTEAPTVASSAHDDPAARRASSDGRALGSAELSIRSVGNGEVVDAGDEGELWVRGPELFAGYLPSASSLADALTEDGWFRTGDLGSTDPDGWLTITGRLKEIIIRAGENISIGEVESVLVAHADVRDAAVVGVPDPRTGERVAAFVVLRDGAATFDLATCGAWFHSQDVARFKTPEELHVVGELPLLPSGKVDRRSLASRR